MGSAGGVHVIRAGRFSLDGDACGGKDKDYTQYRMGVGQIIVP